MIKTFEFPPFPLLALEEPLLILVRSAAKHLAKFGTLETVGPQLALPVDAAPNVTLNERPVLDDLALPACVQQKVVGVLQLSTSAAKPAEVTLARGDWHGIGRGGGRGA